MEQSTESGGAKSAVVAPSARVTVTDGDGKPLGSWQTDEDGTHRPLDGRPLPRREHVETVDLEAIVVALEIALSLPKDHHLLAEFHDRWLAEHEKMSTEVLGFTSKPVPIQTVETILDGLKKL